MSKHTLVELFDATIDVAPESIMLSAPDSIREIYDAMVLSLKDTKIWNPLNIRRIFGAILVICSEFGGVNIYIPFIKNSKVRDRFILSVINMVDAGKELSGSLVIEALKEAAPERNVTSGTNWSDDFSRLISAAHGFLISQKPACSNTEVKEILKLIFEVLLNTCSGRVFYISSCKGLISAMRKQAIWKEFNGSNVRELSARYGLSIPTVYGLLKDCRNERRTMV
ncbi:Mor transcription activator family protein [Aeromonas sp. QDB51]|nr:Mor transcription activator family protein [Aeromonas sp. QDB51]